MAATNMCSNFGSKLSSPPLLSKYAKLSSLSTRCLLAAQKRERAATHMQGTVLTITRLKIIPTIKYLYHIQRQCVDEFSSLI